MSNADVLMDFPTVEAMANTFGVAAGTLGTVNTALQTVATLLSATALIGGIGAAAAAYVANIQQNVQKLSEICTEMKGDLQGAVVSIRDGDESGSKRFV